MYTVTDIHNETGISRDRIKRACRRCGVEKIGIAYVIKTDLEKKLIIEDIGKIRRGNPNFFKKNENNT